jgi:hypothetical protein
MIDMCWLEGDGRMRTKYGISEVYLGTICHRAIFPWYVNLVGVYYMEYSVDAYRLINPLKYTLQTE